VGWAGVVNPGAGSPNELLHWGSLNDGYNDGDPHIMTVDGVRYDFQGAGEFVSLRDSIGMEIQTRMTAIPTTFFPGPDAYTGLASCVSINTAVAARVGNRRVTYEPNLSGVPDPSGLQLRVDGVLTTLGGNELDLGNGGRIRRTSAPGGIQVEFPDGSTMFVTPGWWADQGKWYLNMDVTKTPATMGIMGALAPGSWLPALPDSSSLGLKPASLPQRYTDLYQKFGEAWRVNDNTSLFDYAPGTSTDTFTLRSWPPVNPPCTLPQVKPAQPAEREVAERACRRITDQNRRANCVFDVIVTGEPGFAETYIASQKAIEDSAKGRNNPPTNPPLKGKLALFLDVGVGIPHGTFSNLFNTGFSFNAGLEYLVNSHFSVEGIFGYHRFPGAFQFEAQSFRFNVNLYQLSANAKTYFTAPPNRVRPFVNGGIGIYKFGSGSTNFGGNLGAGVLYELTPRFGLQGSYNFHMVNTTGATTRFSTLQGGVRFVF
jgi:opacity protein-like surface antigen